ncbi:unnamed protein product, partial [marine sediment metagenome]
VGERIAVVLRNKEEKYIVYEEKGKKSIYQATSPIDDKVFDKIIVHRGFRYRPILLIKEETIGIIIEPKFKFFSKYSLRNIIDDTSSFLDYYDYYLEKICPIEECEYYLNPYGLCELNYPETFGKFSDLIIKSKESPSEGYDLIQYYSQEMICPMGSLSKKIVDKPPTVIKYFWSSSDPYKYPIDILRFIPTTRDAGSRSKQLMEEIQPK